LSVRDDGVGMPHDFVRGPGHSLGLDLIRTFAEQLHANVELLRGHGTEIVLSFESPHAAAEGKTRA
ncbi:MAG: hypothetical protein JWN04_2895, partial [Myxococcaceae bacterium]|nr:hypothetical protein [Myxococcaceae bacterium]